VNEKGPLKGQATGVASDLYMDSKTASPGIWLHMLSRSVMRGSQNAEIRRTIVVNKKTSAGETLLYGGNLGTFYFKLEIFRVYNI
jgi:hypothetical protein